MIDASPDLWHQPQSAPSRAHAPKSRRRVLRPASELTACGVDLAAWVDALLAEYTAAHDSARRCRTYALKPTTDRPEQGVQTELRNKHLVRQARVKMALVEALTRR